MPSADRATARLGLSGRAGLLGPRQPPPDEGIVVDLLFASSGIEPEIVARTRPTVRKLREILAGPIEPAATADS